jgi:hypothetical protein
MLAMVLSIVLTGALVAFVVTMHWAASGVIVEAAN